MQNVNILLIDENKLFREGLKKLLDGSAYIIQEQTETVAQALEILKKGLRPKIILIEFDSQTQDFSDLEKIHGLYPEVKIVVLAATTHNIHNLAQCFEAGADAYLLKTISPDALKQSLTLVLLGEKVFPTRLAALLVSGQGEGFRSLQASADLENLSDRELQILRCLLSGHPNKVIAKKLNITEATVKVHLKGVLKKINAANRTQAAIWALNNGLSNETNFTKPARRSVSSHTQEVEILN
jgi:two-component system nitrate/nitrite response regulator NarL